MSRNQLRLNSPVSMCDPVDFSQCWRFCVSSLVWTQTNSSVLLESGIKVVDCDCEQLTAQLVMESDQQAIGSNSAFYSSIVATNVHLQVRIDYTANTSTMTTCTAMYCVTGGAQSVLGVPLHGCVNEGSAAAYWWAIFIGCFAFCCVFSSIFVRRRAVWPVQREFTPATPTPVVTGVPVDSPAATTTIPMATVVERSEASSTPQAKVIAQNKTPPLPSALV